MPWELSESLWKNDTDFYLVLFSVYFLCVTNPSGPRLHDGVRSGLTKIAISIFQTFIKTNRLKIGYNAIKIDRLNKNSFQAAGARQGYISLSRTKNIG